MKARYLLRFDDICPTMNWNVWEEVETILCKEGVNPVLAVVPDNRDDELKVQPPSPFFWDRVRKWQARGWTIAMHGWQHRFLSKHAGVLGINKFSEFAGLERREQEHKLRCGKEVFAREGLDSSVFVAPAHSFDAVTIEILRELDFRFLSDGFFPFPHVDEYGMLWIPQQLWAFRRRPFGIWTICFHINHWGSGEISHFRDNLRRYLGRVSDFRAVIDQYGGRRKSFFDSAAARVYRTSAGTASRAKAAMHQLLAS